jgi:hypothetical protein
MNIVNLSVNEEHRIQGEVHCCLFVCFVCFYPLELFDDKRKRNNIVLTFISRDGGKLINFGIENNLRVYQSGVVVV